MLQKKMRIETIQDNFSRFVKQVPPRLLSTFIIWLDLKVSEFKVNGVMVLDEKLIHKPCWLMEFEVDTDSDDSEEERQEASSSLEPVFLPETPHNSPPCSLPCPDSENTAMYVSPPLPYPDTESSPLCISKGNVPPQALSDKFLNQMAAECERISGRENCSMQTGVASHPDVSGPSSLPLNNSDIHSVHTNELTTEALKSKLLQHVGSKEQTARSCTMEKQHGELQKKDLISDDEIVVKEEILDFDYDLESEQTKFFPNLPNHRFSVPRSVESSYARSSFPLSFHYRNLYNGDKSRKYFEPSIEDTDFEHLQQWYTKSFSDPRVDADSGLTTKNGGLDCVVQMRQSGSRDNNPTNSETTQESLNLAPETEADLVLDYSNRNLKIKDQTSMVNHGTSSATHSVEHDKDNGNVPLSSQSLFSNPLQNENNSRTLNVDGNISEEMKNQQMFLLNQHKLFGYGNNICEPGQTNLTMPKNFPMMLLNQSQNSYYNLSASQYGMGAFTYNRKLMGSLRSPFKRQAWSQAEKAAVYKFLGGFIREMKIPGKSPIEKAQRLCPILQGRTWKNIKYQIYNIICSQKRRQQRSMASLSAQIHSEALHIHNEALQMHNEASLMENKRVDLC